MSHTAAAPQLTPRQHPYPLPGGSPLLRAATGRPQRSPEHRAALQGALLALILIAVLFLSACATLDTRQGADAFDPTFDPARMSLTTVDDAALPIICQTPRARDGCAKRWIDAGGKFEGTCNIYIRRGLLPETSPGFRAVLAHEARHCNGWHHDGE